MEEIKSEENSTGGRILLIVRDEYSASQVSDYLQTSLIGLESIEVAGDLHGSIFFRFRDFVFQQCDKIRKLLKDASIRRNLKGTHRFLFCCIGMIVIIMYI